GGVAHLDADQPRVSIRIVVDQLGAGDEVVVALGDFSGDGRIDVRGRLNRLDDAERLVLRDRIADLRQLDVNDLAELMLREVRDADRRLVALDQHPLVLSGVAELLRKLHPDPPYFWRRTNGSATISAGCCRLRTSTATLVPTSETDRSTNPSAIPRPRVGDLVPLVTAPTG